MTTVPLSLMCHSNHHATGKCITIETGTIEPKMMKAVLEFIFFIWHTAKYRSNPCRWSCLSLKPKLLDFFKKQEKFINTLADKMFGVDDFLAGNQVNHKILSHPLFYIQEPLTDFHRHEEKRKKICLKKGPK